MAVAPPFPKCFKALSGYEPLRWQTRLFERFRNGTIPSICDLPTGLGKTSVVPIWLIAVASQSPDQDCLPRRLAYIVNRRTVVDQATSIVQQLRERLRNPRHWFDHQDVLSDLAGRLRRMAAFDNDEPFGVSTLRGELADNEEWKTDPARPAIIVGTIDMIGSKLLFSGYGDRRYHRAHHAGLIGQDALIVHDEAHLTPAFSEFLWSIADEQQRSGESRRVCVMELSATQRGADRDVLQLQPEDETDERTGQVVKRRFDATKRLRLHKCDSGVAAGLVERAKSYIESPSKVLTYVRSPEDAQKVAGAITKELADAAKDRVALLTGTIRGYERDRLVSENPVYRALLDHEDVPHTMFLVSTSAGEVGVDIDADHMVCDLTTLDSMIQRFGRVNRRGGEGREARVDVLWTEKDAKGGNKPMEKAVAATLATLQRWNSSEGDTDGLPVSPRNLRGLLESLSEQERSAVFSPRPTIPLLTDILLDNWSLTSIDKMPGRPEVAAYLHGLTADPPETFVVWRKEVAVLKQAGADESTLRDWFRACRIEAHERLRDNTDRVRTKMNSLLAAHRKSYPNVDFDIVLLDERGRAEWSTLSAIGKKSDRHAPDLLHYRTVLLPVEVGGLDGRGMLIAETDPKRGARRMGETDVAGRQRARKLLHQDGREFWLASIGSLRATHVEPQSEHETDEDRDADRQEFDSPRDAAAAFAHERDVVVERLIPLKRPEEGEDYEGRGRYLLLMVPPKQSALHDPERAPFEQTLNDHTQRIVEYAERIGKTLNLPDGPENALLCAARWHDRGKDRAVWQRFARNDKGTEPLAKSTRYLHGRALGGYRHEFGSLLEAMADGSLRNHPERELVLHLIATHHGWARPHFEPRSFDYDGPIDPGTGERCPPTSHNNEAALVEAMQRFGRLQQRFGRWGLAWLESLLRCADIAASASPPAPSATGEPVPGEART